MSSHQHTHTHNFETMSARFSTLVWLAGLVAVIAYVPPRYATRGAVALTLWTLLYVAMLLLRHTTFWSQFISPNGRLGWRSVSDRATKHAVHPGKDNDLGGVVKYKWKRQH